MEQRLRQDLQRVEVLLRTKQTQEDEHLLLLKQHIRLRIKHRVQELDLLKGQFKQCIRILHVLKFRISILLGLNIHLHIRQDIRILLRLNIVYKILLRKLEELKFLIKREDKRLIRILQQEEGQAETHLHIRQELR